MNKTIIGYETEKEQINQIRKMLVNPNEYTTKVIRIPRGLLLCGESGVGKTVLARSLVSDGVSLIELNESLSDERNFPAEIKEAFSKAKAKAPSVLLIDELDKLAGRKSMFSGYDVDVNMTLLKELDSLSSEDMVFVVGTCNDTECLGEALLRPGRFDRVINIPGPKESTRLKIIRHYFDLMDLEKDVDYNYLAKISSGLSCADLECLANEVGIVAMGRENPVITNEDAQNVMATMFFSANASENTMSDEDKRIIAVHEAGHCVITMLLRPNDIVGVTIKPRGNSGGYSAAADFENRVVTKTMAETMLAELIAGHVAERVVCGEYTMAASEDLQEASDVIRHLITCCGIYGYKYVGQKQTRISESVLQEIDELAEDIFNRLDAVVENLIVGNRQLFDSVVDALISKQSLFKADLEQILSDYRAWKVA